MRRFNPEKELRKIQRGNKNKVIFSIMVLLLIIAIGSSYALYQIRYNKQIIYTTVDKFYSKDIQISLYVNGEKDTTSETFPTKDSGKIFSHMTCENGSTGVFDNTKWELDLKITKQDKCNVYFVTGNLPNEPELYQGMIPVVYDEKGNIYVADTESDWYNYQDHRWGNAVLVDNTKEGVTEKYFNGTELKEDIAGTKIPMDEILQMYVWIPRYKYQLFNVAGTSKVPEQMINIEFESDTASTGTVSCQYLNKNNGTIEETCVDQGGKEASNGEWYTHPAFTFGSTKLAGMWVGKFESSGIDNNNQITNLKIIPNVSSLLISRLAFTFQGVRDIEEKHSETYNINPDEIDTHMMKNIEWGAVAYLTQSKYGRFNGDGIEIKDGAEVWINNDSNYTTGCSGESVSAESTPCTDEFRWNKSGVHASTTNNISGIYDMAGGAWEYVMGNMVNSSGEFYSSNAIFGSGIINPDPKYYDMYTYGTDPTDMTRGHLGDATKETYKWYGTNSTLPYSFTSWFSRGGIYSRNTTAGVWHSSSSDGIGYDIHSFRVILTVQDREE